MNRPFEIRGFNMCESLLRHTPQQLCRFLDRMKDLQFNNLIVQYDYGFRHYQEIIREKCEKYNIDVTLIAQKPKVKDHISAMQENIAGALGVEVSRVNVKATTEEGLGFTGTLEGISCHAVCLLEE